MVVSNSFYIKLMLKRAIDYQWYGHIKIGINGIHI